MISIFKDNPFLTIEEDCVDKSTSDKLFALLPYYDLVDWQIEAWNGLPSLTLPRGRDDRIKQRMYRDRSCEFLFDCIEKIVGENYDECRLRILAIRGV